MCEARFIQGSHLKKIIEAVRELVTDANLDCSKSGITMQAMDPRRVSLCALMLGVDGFDHYRCDRSLSLGMSMRTISKVMECAGNDDAVTIKANDDPDSLTIMFKNPGGSLFKFVGVVIIQYSVLLYILSYRLCMVITSLLPSILLLYLYTVSLYRASSIELQR